MVEHSATPPTAANKPADLNADWNTDPHRAHVDPLLDCLVFLTRAHGHPWTAEALAAGLPRVGNLLPPSQISRAASRAGLSARLVRRDFLDLPARLLPAILLLNDKRACVLSEVLDDGQLRIHDPETPESSNLVDPQEIAAQYSGTAIVVRPRFRFDMRTPEVGEHRGRHWFWSAIFANWRLYRDALVAAILINVLSLAIPMYTMNVYDRVVPNHAVETLWVLSIGVGMAMLFDFALRTVRAHIIDAASKRVDITLSARIMERVLGMQLAARPASVGSFASNLRSFETVRDFIASATVTTLVDLPFVFLFLVVMAWISPWLLLTPVIGMILVISMAAVTQMKMHELTEATYRASAQRNSTLIESLVGLETIKTLSAEGEIQRRWERATLFISQINARVRLLSSSTVNFAQLIQQLVSVGVVVTGVYLLSEGMMSMGGIIAASMLAGRAMAPLGQVAGLMMQFQNARTSLNTLNDQMKMPVERPDDANFVHRPAFRGDIEFKEVSFSYPNTEQSILRRVSFKINAGEKVAIIGRIGSGKTTLEKLVLGLYQPSEGAVLIDGVDSRQIDPAELRRAVGFVPQDGTLFFGTLRDNIAMGSPFADDNAILAAAQLAGVSEFANAHPKGFDMPIGERGELLSGGQRQAVAIARAVLNEPPILVLDEPTSSMDHQSEEQLRTRLATYATSKTLLLVTHRTSLLSLVERLIVIDNGMIVADGPKAQVVEALQHGRVGKAN